MLIYDTKNNKLYPSVENLSVHFNFKPALDKKLYNQDFFYVDKEVNSSFNSKAVNIIEMQKDTFIFLGKRKFPKNYYDNM